MTEGRLGTALGVAKLFVVQRELKCKSIGSEKETMGKAALRSRNGEVIISMSWEVALVELAG